MTVQTGRPFVLDRRFPEIAILGLGSILYVPLLIHWFDGWLNKSIGIEHEYFSHGVLGLPFAAYLIWSQRDRWQQLSDETNLSRQILGLSLLILSLSFYLSSLPSLINLSLPTLLVGICLWFKGLPGLRLQSFPLLLIFLATPNEIPYLLAPYTLPLQSFIAGMAGFLLMQLGMNVQVDQIYLFVNDRIVEVAPYCAGLKMLFTGLYVGLMLLYWTGAWTCRKTVVLFYSGIIVISISANVIRNTLLTFFHGTGQEEAFHWLHDGWGGDLYSTGMLGLIVLLLKGLEIWIPALTGADLTGADPTEAELTEEDAEVPTPEPGV